MDPIDMEPLSSAQPATLVHYGTYEDKTPTVRGFKEKKSHPF